MRTRMRVTGLALLLLSACVLVGPGCIKIDSTLTFDKEGAGSFRTQYAMPTFLVKQMEMARQLTRSMMLAEGKSTNAPLPALDIPQLFDEAVLKTRFQEMEASGLKLESLRTREQGGWQYVDFTLKFTRLEALITQSFFRDCGFRFSHVGGDVCKLAITPPSVGVPSGGGDRGSQETVAKLTPFLGGLRVLIRIDVPGEIRNSTSVMSDNVRATWEWDFEKDTRVMERLSQDKLVVVFDGRLVRMKEFEKPAGSLVLK